MLANREGTFNAYPIDIGVDETGPNSLATVIIAFGLCEERVGAEWVDCSGEGMEITAWFYLEKRDGSVNEITIERLKTALGWDGRDPFWLQDQAAELAQQAVQVKLAFEQYNGSTSLRVQYLNPYGYEGAGISKADDAKRKAMQRRLGSKLRALAGGTPANPPKPASPPGAPPPTQAALSAPECSMEEAWSAFCAAYENAGPGGSSEDREQQWFETLAKLFAGRQPSQLTEADWAVMHDRGPAEIVPF